MLLLFNIPLPLLHPHPPQSRHQPPRNPSPERPDPHGPPKTHPPPYPLLHTCGEKKHVVTLGLLLVRISLHEYLLKKGGTLESILKRKRERVRERERQRETVTYRERKRQKKTKRESKNQREPNNPFPPMLLNSVGPLAPHWFIIHSCKIMAIYKIKT